MNLQPNDETSEQQSLFPKQNCRQILRPTYTRPRLRPAHSPERLWTRKDACLRQPYALKLHRAQKLHLDLRLCYHYIAFSWALYLLPSHCPNQSCVAIQVEDHLRENLLFEGVHPEGQRGAGPTIVVDQGTWSPLPEYLDIEQSLHAGAIHFAFEGCNLLRGSWSLTRQNNSSRQENPRWILAKEEDAYTAGMDIAQEKNWQQLRSCRTGHTLEEIESDWRSGIQPFRSGESLFPSFHP
jgi:DNA ligase D-like protein (predicted 3'-phosphoesterase)